MHLISLSLIVFAQALLLHVFGFPDGKFALEPSTFAIDARSDVNSPGIALHRRQLVAARSTDELKARDSAVNGFLGNSHILHFIDGMQKRTTIRSIVTDGNRKILKRLQIAIQDTKNKHHLLLTCI